MKLKDVDRIMDFARDAVNNEYGDEWYYTYALRAICIGLTEQSRYSEARKIGKYLVDNFPDYTGARISYATTLERLKEYKEALKIISGAHNYRAKENVWLIYCRLLEKNQRNDIALTEYKALVEEFPDYYDGIFAYACAFEHNNCYEESQIILEMLIENFPDYWLPYINYGTILNKELGEY